MRTTALMQSSLAVLERIGVWPAVAPDTGALKKLRLIDATGSLVRAPEILFDCAELGLTAFGHNIQNTRLLAALHDAARNLPGLTIVPEAATAVRYETGHVRARLANGAEIVASLAIGADGRNSICRTAAGIQVKEHDYPQAALAFNIAHTRPHDSISTEFHRRGGPVVFVPLPGNRSSIVYVNTLEETERLASLDPSALGRELENLTQGLLGRITPDKPRGSRALSSLEAARFAQNRIALVGEAAHVLPPIGAQGLNLGIRDAAAIAERAAEAVARGGDPGSPELLASYDRARRADTTPRQIAVDVLNRSLLSDLLPFDAGRSLGLWALGAIPPLRREVMRRGVALPS
jgi:2-octaprenyl-6-methoxyphenol hydroxylase